MLPKFLGFILKVKVIYLFRQNGLGYIFGDFSKNSSGHPEFTFLLLPHKRN
jgi:hypothetical protein